MMRRQFCYKAVFAIILVALVPWEIASAAVLAKDGTNRTTIVVAPDLPGATRYAIDDLAMYLGQIAGTEAPAVVDSAEEVQTPVTIWVGPSDAAKARFADVDLAVDEHEELLIAVRDDDVLLMGRNETTEIGKAHQAGTAQAIYTFIHDQLDVRWLWPGELGTDVPQRETIALDEFTLRYAPPLRQRMLRISTYDALDFNETYSSQHSDVDAIAARLQTEARAWYRRQHGTYAPGRDNYVRRMRAGHAYTRWYDRYAESHPDYFALQPDGNRNAYPNAKNVKLCISNPDVVKQKIDNAVARWGDTPPSSAVTSVSPNDSGYAGYCTCEDCRAWDAADGPTVELRWEDQQREHVALTDRYVHFWNRVARGLKERYPDQDVSVATWAYGAYRTPPVANTLEDNVLIGLVTDMGSASEAGRAEGRELWRQWAEAAPELHWRPNLFHGSWAVPALFTRRIAADFAFMADHHLAGIDVDSAMNHWATQGLQYYVLAQLAWNPHADIDALIKDYTDRAFGPEAGVYMRQYFQKLEQAFYALQEKRTGLHRYEQTPLFPEVYTPELFTDLRRQIERAYSAVTGPRAELHRKRIAFVEVGLNFTEAQISTIQAMNNLRHGAGADIQATVRRAFDAAEQRDQLLHDQLESHTLNTTYAFGNRRRRTMLDYLGPPDDSYRALLAGDGESSGRLALPIEWDFRMDPDEVGRREHWYEQAVAEELDWRGIQVTKPWDNQLLSDDPVDPAPLDYHGIGWYRVTFDAAPVSSDEALWLHFGAIDEGARVYLNGELVGEQPYDADSDPDAWKKPRRFEITDHVREGENHLAVEVRSDLGQSGITRPAVTRRMARNLVPNAGFEHGLEDWRLGPSQGSEDGYTSDFTLGQFVAERALRVEIRDGGKASMHQVIAHPLEAGRRYQVSVRYRQQLNGVSESDIAPLRVRLYGLAANDERRSEDRFWLRGTDSPNTDWTSLVGVFEAPRAYESFRVSLYFWVAGQYHVDEVIVRPVD